MIKTPDELVKTLERCYTCTPCGDGEPECPYDCGSEDCIYHLLYDAHAYIQQVEAKVPRWISVEEKLPEAHKNVLVYMTTPIGWWKVEIDWLDEQGWVCSADSEWHTITHWMPLPEPPKEG